MKTNPSYLRWICCLLHDGSEFKKSGGCPQYGITFKGGRGGSGCLMSSIGRQCERKYASKQVKPFISQYPITHLGTVHGNEENGIKNRRKIKSG